MNVKQKIVLSITLPLLLGAVIYPPHHESGSVSGKTYGQAYGWPLEEAWVLRPLVAPKEMTLTIEHVGGSGVSHREYTVIPWLWLVNVLTLLILGGGLFVLLRSASRQAPDSRDKNALDQAKASQAGNAPRRADGQKGIRREAGQGVAQFRTIR